MAELGQCRALRGGRVPVLCWRHPLRPPFAPLPDRPLCAGRLTVPALRGGADLRQHLGHVAEREEDLLEIEKAIKNRGWIKEEPEILDNQ